jgi:hypothetical protein
MSFPVRADGSKIKHTWGIVANRADKQVIMFNMTQEEAERIASKHPDLFLVAPICARHYRPRGWE